MRPIKILLLTAIFTAAAAGSFWVGAYSSANYSLDWSVLGGGGAAATSASYQINGTTGQPLAGLPLLTSPSYELSSGYWLSDQLVFLPLTTK